MNETAELMDPCLNRYKQTDASIGDALVRLMDICYCNGYLLV